MYDGDELGLTKSLLPEAVLVIAQNLVAFQNVHEIIMHYMFRDNRMSVKLAGN